MDPLKVLVAERNESFRTALVELLKQQGGIEIVDHAKSGREAILLAYSLHPQVILLDHGITGTSKLDIVKEIKMVVPDTKIVILTFQDAETSRTLKEVLAVDECVSKDNLKRDLLPALIRFRNQLSRKSVS